MLAGLKRLIDKAAIDLAAKSLPPGVPNASKAAIAAEWLEHPDLLKPAGVAACMSVDLRGVFRFESAVRSGDPKNDLVHGRVFLSGSAWATRPMVVLVHGWNAELHYLYILPRVARLLNRAGMNAALFELPYHMQRRPPPERNRVHDFISDDLPGMLHATKQAISDIDSLSRWAMGQGCPATAVWGFSLGAWLAGLYICESDLARAAVLTTPVADLARAVAELAFCHPIRSSLCSEELDLTGLNLANRIPRLHPDAIQVVQSVYDLFVPEATYEELAAAWMLGGWVREPQGHISVLTSRKAMRRSVDWLKERLKADAW